MSDEAVGYIGQIKMVPYQISLPNGWQTCDGRYLGVAEYPELYDLIGNTYGGNGLRFQLPDLTHRVPVAAAVKVDANGNITSHNIGEAAGSTGITLKQSDVPLSGVENNLSLSVTKASTVAPTVTHGPTTTDNPTNVYPGINLSNAASYAPANHATESMATSPVHKTGGYAIQGGLSINSPGKAKPISNLQPTLDLRFIICVEGTRPAVDERMPGFIGEITLWSGTTCIPKGWRLCDGSALPNPVSSEVASFASTAGANGPHCTPNLTGRTPMGIDDHLMPDNGNRNLGKLIGSNTHKLKVSELPANAMTLNSTLSIKGDLNLNYTPLCGTSGDSDSPEDAHPCVRENDSSNFYGPPVASNTAMGASTVNYTGDLSLTGGITQPTSTQTAIDLRQPYIALAFIICVDGYYPHKQGVERKYHSVVLPPTMPGRLQGEICMRWGPTEAPFGWLLCNGASAVGKADQTFIDTMLSFTFQTPEQKKAKSHKGYGLLPSFNGRVPRGAKVNKKPIYTKPGKVLLGFRVSVLPGGWAGSPNVAIPTKSLPPFQVPLTHTLGIDSSGLSASVTPPCSSTAGTLHSPVGNYYAQSAGDAGDDWATADEAHNKMGPTNIAFNTTLGGTVALTDANKWKGSPMDLHMPTIGVHFVMCTYGANPVFGHGDAVPPNGYQP